MQTQQSHANTAEPYLMHSMGKVERDELVEEGLAESRDDVAAHGDQQR